ncbi:MAG: FAD-dependent oxidoreductase [Caldimicrobium sp.]|nr:FAD-dependent oxidoreductase [Caldimicrobium sp.]MCX7873904.1 FAD-dependent oxidoreductase [Caldimicrobium sp.]MDW8094714.1 FAD-dependent oxidoreductase [Caldimicrobium sp.]
MVEAGRSPNIEILTLADVLKVEGEAGKFEVTLKLNPRYIDESKCTACGDCMKYCPRLAIDTYNANLNFTRSARIDFPQAVPTKYYIDPETCLRLNHQTCQLCANVCGPKAIDFDQKPELRTIRVGAILLAPGFGKVPKEALQRFGYGKYSDVLHSIEMERITCVAGPTEGEVIRPSDFKHPKRIAYIQCVGSRDVTCGQPYCSSVCCMYAMKQATVIKEHEPSAEITLFFMDIRTQGKGFDESFQQAVEKYGFRVVRARPGKIDKVDGRLVLNYVSEEGKVERDYFDLVVLSLGLSPPEDAEKLAEIFGIELNEFKFAKTKYLSPIETSRPGIYVVGAFQGPKDIPESVMQASGGAALISELLKEGRWTSTVIKEYPPEDQELIAEEPRIGVFVCHCGVNIAGVVDVKEVRDYALNLPNVVLAENMVYACAQDALEQLKEKIKKYRLNRIVVSACSPRTHEPLFQDTLREAGLNLALIEMANIRDQCSWVHPDNPQKATEKAKDLVRMAVAKARRLKPLELQRVSVTTSALVIGGGVAGMTSALSIAEQGFQVYLVEKERTLGGNLNRVKFIITGEDPQRFLKDLMDKVTKHPKIKVYTEASIESISGYIGNYTTTLRVGDGSEIINHGVIVVATGGKEYRPKSYPLDGERVLTQLEFEQMLSQKKKSKVFPRSVVMIQCAGSRGEELSYCSKFCCVQALKNALRIKEMSPDTEVYILYMDLRAYGFYEKYYLEARKRGVKFIRFPESKRPKVSLLGKGVVVRVWDTLLSEEVDIKGDLCVLSVGVVPPEDRSIINILKLSQNQEGFLMEAHVKLKPVETTTDGVYIAGLAHSPQPLTEVIAQAKASAGKAAIPLARGYVEVPPIVAAVQVEKCIGCSICAEICPFSAIEMVKIEKRKKAQVIKAACKGCGICASHCPVFAIDVGGFTSEAILEQVKGFRREEREELVEEKKVEIL